ncbi:MAG: hypothetical protein AAF907_08885 [Planctomycetota bacterium]
MVDEHLVGPAAALGGYLALLGVWAAIVVRCASLFLDRPVRGTLLGWFDCLGAGCAWLSVTAAGLCVVGAAFWLLSAAADGLLDSTFERLFLGVTFIASVWLTAAGTAFAGLPPKGTPRGSALIVSGVAGAALVVGCIAPVALGLTWL